MSTHRSIVTIGTKSASAMWDELLAQENLPTESELVAQGWRSLSRIADDLGSSIRAANHWTDKQERAGLLESCEGRTRARKRAKFFRPCKSPSK